MIYGHLIILESRQINYSISSYSFWTGISFICPNPHVSLRTQVSFHPQVKADFQNDMFFEWFALFEKSGKIGALKSAAVQSNFVCVYWAFIYAHRSDEGWEAMETEAWHQTLRDATAHPVKHLVALWSRLW